jgi:glycosyl transferase family 25
MVPIYYINLASRQDRRAFMERQFEQLSIKAERIEAVTPDQITAAELKPHLDQNNPYAASPAEVACALSHRRAWATMLERGQPAALILEDDVTLSSSLRSTLVADIPRSTGAGIVRLERSTRKVALGQIRSNVADGITVRTLLSTDYGSAAYLMTDWMARRILADPRFQAMTMDGYLFMRGSPVFPSRDIVQCDPAPCEQLHPSTPDMPPARSDLVRTRFIRTSARRLPWRAKWRVAADDLGYTLRSTYLALREGVNPRRRVIEFAPDQHD